MYGKRMRYYVILAGLGLLLSACAPGIQWDVSHMKPDARSMEPDLMIYAAWEEAVYQPIIKEFEERTGYLVSVKNGSSRELLEALEPEGKREEPPDWDALFGVGIETLEEFKEFLLPYESDQESSINPLFRSEDYRWTGFSALPLVIMYNTNVVTYRELPQGFMSLLEPRWKGRIAFLDPKASDVYSHALVTAVKACSGEKDYLPRLMANLDYSTLSDLGQVDSGIVEGKYSLGVTSEESALALRLDGGDVDYVYPCEGTGALVDGAAIVKGCRHEAAAKEFLDFTISLDVQRILAADLNRRSVRGDVLPLPGLAPIAALNLMTMDIQALSREKAVVMKRWNHILEDRESERGSDG